VRAIDNNRVDGMDTKVFAPQLNQLNNIQGPLFINGGQGTDRTGLLEREPVMLPRERNELPAMGHVVSSTPGTPNNTVAATVTVDPSTLAQVGIESMTADNTIQDVIVDAIGGTFTLTYGGMTTLVSLPFNAPAIAVENALKALSTVTALFTHPNSTVKVSQNSNVYEITFVNPGTMPVLLSATGSGLLPQHPADVVNYTIEITRGPAKNKTRIITGAVQDGANWTLTLDKPWLSLFTGDASRPDSTSLFTLLATNPNLLVDPNAATNLLYLYDTDNPANAAQTPFGAGRLFFDANPFGPPNAAGVVLPLNQFRITGLGMGPNRCIGGPANDLVSGDEAAACNGPVGANEPGGVTFKNVQDLQVNLGPGGNHFTIQDTPAGTMTELNTGVGDDVVDVLHMSGHTFVNTGAGNDTVNVHDSGNTLAGVSGLLTVSGDSPQATMLDLVDGSPAQGTAVDAVNAMQRLTVDATSGSFTISYAPQPLNLTASVGAGTGTLAAATYYYEITATTGAGETLPSPQAFATVRAGGSVVLGWYPVPFATSYNVYRGTAAGLVFLLASGWTGTAYTDAGGATTSAAPPSVGVVQTQTVTYVPNTGAGAIQAALDAMTLVGSGNTHVTAAGNVFAIRFMGSLAGTAIPLLLTDPTRLRNGAGALDVLNVSDRGATADDAALLTSSSLTGLDMSSSNTIQELSIDATSGQYNLEYRFPVVVTGLAAHVALGGTLAAGYHFYVVTGVTGAGHESLASKEVVAVTADSGSVQLSWTAMPWATSYRVYRGSSPGGESVLVASTTLTSLTDTGSGTFATPPSTSDVTDSVTTPTPLDYNASAAAVQAALEGLAGTGNVVVSKNDEVYVIRFQGSLSDTVVLPLIPHSVNLQKAVEQPGGGVGAGTASANLTVRAAGLNDPANNRNQVQVLTIDATSGSYELQFLVGGVTFTTAPIPYNVGAEQLRQTIQNAIAVGETGDPNLRLFVQDDVDVTVDRYPSGNWYPLHNLDIYVLNFQGLLRKFARGVGLNTIAIVNSSLVPSVAGQPAATVTTRMDGIDYYGVEQVNIETGSGSDIFNVQGTSPGSNDFSGTAITNVNTNAATGAAGNDRVYVSSNADLDQASSRGQSGTATWTPLDFLTGNLDDVRGALNIDLGAGRHRLFMSDEGSSVGDSVTITRNLAAHGLNAAALGLDTAAGDIYVVGLAPGAISYKTSGNLYDGVAYWTGSGGDTVNIDATHDRPAPDAHGNATERTTTLLNTGLGDDNVTVNLQVGADGFFVLNTSGGSATGDPIAHSAGGASDNDMVDASASNLPLVIFGGFGGDLIRGGQGSDVILGDLGRVQYTALAGTQIIAQFGYGGRGDLISDQVVDPRWVYSFVPDLLTGGNDTLYGNRGEDVLVGGAGDDRVDGGTGDDLIFGDAVRLFRRDVNPYGLGLITDPRYQALAQTQIYSTTAGTTLGQALNDGHPQNYRDGDGSYAPAWAEYVIQNLYQSSDPVLHALYPAGNDYIAGGPGDDRIFGQGGNDTIQGDGSIDYSALGCSGVGAFRDASNALVLCPSKDNLGPGTYDHGTGVDGNDYIEGGAGSDTIFGNQGQDDIVGGNSDLFTLVTPSQRDDSPNMIFGGSGTDVARNDMGATGNGADAHDSDAIVANNGDIVRLVAVNGATRATGFLTFNYDTYPGTERIIPRTVKLLDYTPGGPDLQGKATLGPVSAGDIGATGVPGGQARGTEIHGENGDDFIYGGPGNDVLFGDGQNDTMVGGYGNDWMSGGTGDDGLLGDDGRLFSSRDGLAAGEPLYGIAPIAKPSQMIATSGNLQQALINVNGEIKYTALLVPDNLDPSLTPPHTTMPRPLYASDIMYGGLGSDAMHGGAGEDAMSGAEAPALSFTNSYSTAGIQINLTPIESDFGRPFNPGNVLGYNPTTTKFAQYDAFDRGAR